MLENLKKPRTLIAIFLTLALVISVLYFPIFAPIISMLILLISVGMALIIILQNHWHAYFEAECTREKMIRNLARDVFGLLLAMSAAIFAGGQAGQWAGMQAGLWAGLGAGFLVGFLAAWAVRSVWGRLVPLA